MALTPGAIALELGARLEEDSAGRPVLLVSATAGPEHREEILLATVRTLEEGG